MELQTGSPESDVPPESIAGERLDELLIFGTPRTRRRFLKKISGTGVALVLGPNLLGSEMLAAAEVAKSVRAADQSVRFHLIVNGRDIPLEIDPRVTLLDLLRDHLGLTGTKKGCDHGQCGACTVLVKGRRINSCLSLAVTHDGDQIQTIEGLATGDQLHPVQAAFLEHDGFQCGYCTPGQICSAVALLQEGHAGSDEEIREWMSGNICRCGAYPNILKAIRTAKAKQSAI